MNLQRREEIRELIAEIAQYEELGATLDLEGKARDAINELLAHIGTLEQTAAERVIARGAVIAPHTFGEVVNQVRDIAIQYAGTEQLRERIAYALAPHFERDAGLTPDYTGEVSAWAPPVAVRAAAGPELTLYDVIDIVGCDDSKPWEIITSELNKKLHSRSRAIPADRVPGDGMVAVSVEAIRDIEIYIGGKGIVQPTHQEFKDRNFVLDEIRSKLRALRTNQGGAAT